MINRYHRHAHDLANKNQIMLLESDERPPEFASALPALRIVQCGIILTDAVYATALHEMGHVVSPYSIETAAMIARGLRNLTEVNACVDEEKRAWDWARDNAFEWTAGMEQVHRWAYGTYVSDLGKKWMDQLASEAKKINRKKISDLKL